MSKNEVSFLVFSDMHDKISGLKKLDYWLKTEKINLAICCGDLSNAQTPNQIAKIKKVMEIIKKHHLLFYSIYGNNEREETIEYLRQEKIYLEEINFKEYHLVGISGWGETIPPLKMPIDQKTILITHVPPKLKNITNLKNAPFLHLHGHTHMPYNKKVINDTIIINVPPLMNDLALKIILPKMEVKILS